MGAIGDAMAAYVQPLLDETDGSHEQVNKAFQIGMLCWNLSLLSEEARERSIGDMRADLDQMDDAEFEAFRNTIIVPMIRRHEEMFPLLHGQHAVKTERKPFPPRTRQETPSASEKYRGTGRNDPCPCGSGKKYKRCCGR
jgi:uncharacterized protein YecA (UPF0149 family)